MKARLTFLAGTLRGQRRVFKDQAITIGGDRSHRVYLPNVGSCDLLALIKYHDCEYTIESHHRKGLLTVNDLPVRRRVLEEGDLIRVGQSDVIRFGFVPESGDVCKPIRFIGRQSFQNARQLDAGPVRRAMFFARDLLHTFGQDASRHTKVAWAVGAAAIAVAFGVAGVSFAKARATERQAIELSARVAASAASGQRLEEEAARVRALDQERVRTEARLTQVTRELDTAAQRLARLERQGPDLLAAIATARQSVAFVLVGYGLYEKKSGRPLRYLSVDEHGIPQADQNGRFDTSVDGAGPMVLSYSTGSGFLIDATRIVTNHHVAVPWWGDDTVEAAIRRGFEPRRTVTRAYFPDVERPVDLKVVAISPAADVAIVQGTMPAGLPWLTLAAPAAAVRPGDQMVAVGYPTGFDVLLAKADDTVAREITTRTKGDYPALANALARRDLITPLVTLGNIGDVRSNTIVYDAATTHGSSGGPVLNAAGEVIAVNYAGLDDFAGARFGIPIRFVHEMVKRN
jgi:S1-C subfamily serine protease